MPRFLADAIVVFHFGFVAFVVAGGALVLRWRRLLPWHLAALAWGIVVELTGWICPLTPLENHFRALAGERGYGGDFVAHYLLPVLYPAGLTRTMQLAIAGVIVAVNVAIYTLVVLRWRGRARP